MTASFDLSSSSFFTCFYFLFTHVVLRSETESKCFQRRGVCGGVEYYMWLQAFRLFLFSMVFSLHHNRRSGGAIKKSWGNRSKLATCKRDCWTLHWKKSTQQRDIFYQKKQKPCALHVKKLSAMQCHRKPPDLIFALWFFFSSQLV